FNGTPSPNLFDHYFLAFLRTFFEARICEKILVLVYFFAFPLSVRYLIKQFNPSNLFLSLFAIPLSHSVLFYLGFFNYSYSFIFLFLSIGFYYSNFYLAP